MVIVDLSCPWELYLFASCHLVMGLVNYLDDSSHRNPAPTRSCFGKGFTPHLSSASMGSIGLCDTFMQLLLVAAVEAEDYVHFQDTKKLIRVLMFCEIGVKVISPLT